MAKFWYNTATGEVEEGRQSSWSNRMGPYKTRAEAEQAVHTARRRTQAWDDEDAAWRGTKDAAE